MQIRRSDALIVIKAEDDAARRALLSAGGLSIVSRIEALAPIFAHRITLHDTHDYVSDDIDGVNTGYPLNYEATAWARNSSNARFSYLAARDNIAEKILECEIQRLFVCGFTTKHCLAQLVIIANDLTLPISVITDALSAIDLPPAKRTTDFVGNHPSTVSIVKSEDLYVSDRAAA